MNGEKTVEERLAWLEEAVRLLLGGRRDGAQAEADGLRAFAKVASRVTRLEEMLGVRGD